MHSPLLTLQRHGCKLRMWPCGTHQPIVSIITQACIVCAHAPCDAYCLRLLLASYKGC